MSKEDTTEEDLCANFYNQEIKNLRDQVFEKYELINGIIVEAKKEIESFYQFCRESAEQCPLIKKDNYKDWYTAIDVMKLHDESFDMFTRTIKQAFRAFENYFNSLSGYLSSTALDIAHKTVELFSSVQIKAENRMKKIQELIQVMKDL